MAWSPDGETLAVASGEQIHLYQTSGFKERLVLEAGGWSPALAFSPDSLWIASGGRDGGLRLWDAVTGRPGFVIPAHKKGTNAVTFDPGGKWLATAGNDGMVRLWDAGNGSLKSEMIGGTFGIPAVAYTPDGEGLAIANGNVIRIRKVQDGRFVQTLRGEGSFYCLALSSRGHLLASGDSANTVLLWDWQRGEALGKMTGHSGEASRPTGLIWRVAFSPDERLLASAGGDGTMRLWDVASGELLATLSGHSAAVTSLAFSPDGVWLATGGLDARVLLWRT
jgi:WD40 repeat protein